MSFIDKGDVLAVVRERTSTVMNGGVFSMLERQRETGFERNLAKYSGLDAVRFLQVNAKPFCSVTHQLRTA